MQAARGASLNPSDQADQVPSRPRPDARLVFATADYIDDVRLIYRVIDPNAGTSKYNAIIFGRAVVEPWTQTGEDSNEQSRSLDLKGILPALMSKNKCPYVEIEDYDHATFDVTDYFTLS